MNKNLSNSELAKILYDLAGGPANVESAYNCMTRLRFLLKDTKIADQEAMKRVPGVLGTNLMEQELQVILGPGKALAVTNALLEQIKQEPARPAIGDGKALHEEIRQKNNTPVKAFFKKIASIFLPLIPAFIGCGLLTGILAIAAKIDPSLTASPLWQTLATLGGAIFWGMNLFVGWQAAKVFGGTPILGGALAAFVSHPGLKGIELFGNELLPGRGGIISVILIAALAVFIEKRLHKLVPEMLDLFVTPCLTLLLSGLAAVLVFQPIGGAIASAIGQAATASITDGGAPVGAILAGIWLPMVMMGVHQVFTPIHVALLEQYGVTILLPVLAMAGAGQVGAAIAIYFNTKNKFLKKTILSALPVGMMGVGEPLIYGVTLPLGKPFLGACLGATVGGAIEAGAAVGAGAIGISGLPLAPTVNNIPVYLLGLVASYAAGFAATWLLGFDDPEETELPKSM
ncbi:PTS transporter subunit EIIC [Selenomonas sp. AB3002]|uniref:PTS transporter subunit EIIC n=1 Tax=Selenomonas sp. AB3002 TaxID=1392502 RepID=UPI000496655E